MDRVFPAPDADERQTLTGWLDWQRATVRRKLVGVADRDAHRTMLPTSPTVTLAGITSHLRWTEWSWFSQSFPSLADGPAPATRDTCGWTVEEQPIAALVDDYELECARSRRLVDALALDDVQEFTPSAFDPVTVRWILTHMIDETARHLGHLDILRELTDGTRSY